MPGTRFRRSQIDQRNFNEFMNEKLRVPSYRALLNTTRISDKAIKNQDWAKAMWKYNLGETVLANARLVKGGKGVFFKPSQEGYFSSEPYVIASRYLSTTRKMTLVPGSFVSC